MMNVPDKADWITDLLDGAKPAEGERISRLGRELLMDGGILRDESLIERKQAQTRDTFAFKWGKRATYSSEAMRDNMRVWLRDRYGDLESVAKISADGLPLVLDAGCGAGYSGSLAFEGIFPRIRYVGADISKAVDIAAETIGALAPQSFFIQADLMALPFAAGSFDLIFSEGVMHHTPSTRDAIHSLSRLVKPGGAFAFYVYAKKAPVREFTDDYIRAIASEMPPQEAWDALMPLSKLGKALGELNIEIEIPEDIEVLGISKGRHNLQRLFYWNICKAYYRPELTLEEMNHINFDWFTPKYSFRQTPEEVRTWCQEAGLEIERLKVEEAGMTVLARRKPN